MAPSTDGTIRVDEVEPGNFAVNCGAYQTDSDGKPTARVKAAPIMISVPADPATGTIDLGVITLQPAPL